jgi:hypothetical protein
MLELLQVGRTNRRETMRKKILVFRRGDGHQPTLGKISTSFAYNQTQDIGITVSSHAMASLVLQR